MTASQVDTTRAWARARRRYRSPQFQRAYVRGARAALAGLPIDACPYRNREGWTAWRNAWLSGYHSIDSGSALE